MTAETTLSSQEFERALAVLQREQEAYLPSARQKFLFNLFYWSVFSFVAISGLYVFIVFLIVGTDADQGVFHLIFIGIISLICILIVLLFFANLPFMIKLFRQARLRRRLHLKEVLSPLFKAGRQKTRIVNFFTFLWAIPGGLLVVMAILFAIFGIITTFETGAYLLFVMLASVLIVLGLSLVFAPFMRREKQRLEIVTNLHGSLLRQRQVLETGCDAAGEISSSDYSKIASIEKAQIIDDRQLSITKARQEAAGTDYLIQSSREMLDAKSQLDPMTQARLEMQIPRLQSDPSPPEVSQDPSTGYLRLPIPETSVEILYQIDHERRRIRLLSLRTQSD